MSFDVFFQRFVGGERCTSGGELMREVLQPYIVRDVPDQQFAYIEIGDGSADLYLDENDMMANHISGEAPWDLLVRGAKAADWVIIPVGCPTCITHEEQRDHLPEELRDEAAFVANGADLLSVIRSACHRERGELTHSRIAADRGAVAGAAGADDVCRA